jgi:hypothetical protein
LHPKQNLESELNWQACFGALPSQFSSASVKGLSEPQFFSSVPDPTLRGGCMLCFLDDGQGMTTGDLTVFYMIYL